MKIFVVSDTHGSTREFIEKAISMGKPDFIIHLGDYVEDADKIEEAIGIKTVVVKGNGDYFHSEYDEDDILDIGDKKIFITHGHKYNVRYSVDNLFYKAKEVDADLVLFGHTHVPVFFEEHGIFIMNPGSASMPRGFNRKKTFGIIEIKEKILGSIIEIN